jgi:hypothetical protein
MGMGPGEGSWWTAEHHDLGIASLMEADPKLERVSAASVFQRKWREDIGMSMMLTLTEGDNADDKITPIQVTKRRGGKSRALGDPAASRLFLNPQGLEMMLDCRPALWVFNTLLERPYTVEMLKPSGAPLIAHFWLDTRTLINVRS